MRLTKTTVKKIIGYLSSIIVLIFLGEPMVAGVGEAIDLIGEEGAATESASNPYRY